LAVETFFKNLNQNYMTELKTLLSLKFQFFDTDDSLIYPL